MLLRTAVCDDDKEDAGHILSFIKKYEMQYDTDFETTVFLSPKDMLSAYSAPGAFHLAFLDVEMPQMNGILLAKELRSLNDRGLKIVFVSNYPQYMQDSFPVHPVHYLTKPLLYHDFIKVMEQVLKEIESSFIYKTLVKTDGKEEFINIYDIMYMEAVKGKKAMLSFHMKDSSFETPGALSYWEEELKEHRFFSPYRGILLNLNYIHYLRQDKIILHNGKALPLSRRKSKEMHQLLSRRLTTFYQD